MEQDVIAEKVQEMLDADEKRTLVRRRIKVDRDLWKDMGDYADSKRITRDELIEILWTTSGTSHKDATIASQTSMMEAMAETLAMYRRLLEYAGVDVGRFSKEDS